LKHENDDTEALGANGMRGVGKFGVTGRARKVIYRQNGKNTEAIAVRQKKKKGKKDYFK